MSDIVLFHLPPSGYSQVARILLAEKGVRYRSRYVFGGPPKFAGYAPWYMRMNPQGTVPTLRVDGLAVPGSIAIGRYVEEHMPGPSLIPDDPVPRGSMEHWLDIFEGTSLGVISYGSLSGRKKRNATWMNNARLRNLRKRQRKNPELADLYAAKIEYIEKFMRSIANSAEVAKNVAKLNSDLDALGPLLGAQPFIAGKTYSLADGAWTVLLARLQTLELAPFNGRRALESWYQEMRERPSFAQADVWESMSMGRMIKVAFRLLV
jgi:glutathione S-transferase